MNISALEDLGLTPAEIAVYVALLETGKSKSGPIIERASIHPSTAFLAFKTLGEKGLITTVRSGKLHLYTATDPEALLILAEERKKQIENILPELRAKKKQEAQEGATIFEGIKGLQTLFFSLADSMKKGEEFFYFDAEGHGHEERARLVYVPFHTRAKDKGVIVQGIHKSDTPNKEAYGKDAHIRITDQTIPPDTSIFRDKLILVSWSDTPKAVLIESAQLADQYREVWKALWGTLN